MDIIDIIHSTAYIDGHYGHYTQDRQPTVMNIIDIIHSTDSLQ